MNETKQTQVEAKLTLNHESICKILDVLRKSEPINSEYKQISIKVTELNENGNSGIECCLLLKSVENERLDISLSQDDKSSNSILIADEEAFRKVENELIRFRIVTINLAYIDKRPNKKILAGVYSLLIKNKILRAKYCRKKNSDPVKAECRLIVKFLNHRYQIKDLQAFTRSRDKCERCALNAIPTIREILAINVPYKTYKS